MREILIRAFNRYIQGDWITLKLKKPLTVKADQTVDFMTNGDVLIDGEVCKEAKFKWRSRHILNKLEKRRNKKCQTK
jgi:hypothetical protein